MKKKETGSSVSYYDVLQVRPSASDSDIRTAYYKLAKRFHPDKNPQERRLAELRFRLINEAYAHLKTQDRRMRYNMALKKNAALKKSEKSFRTMRKEAGNDNRKSHNTHNSWMNALSNLFGLNNKSTPTSKA